MAFAAEVIFGARTFSRIFIDVLSKSRLPTDHCRITKFLREELCCWSSFARTVSGLGEFGKVRPEMSICTDASFSGFGAVLDRNRWLTSVWDNLAVLPLAFKIIEVPVPAVDDPFKRNINCSELLAVCIPFLVWAPCFKVIRL